MCIYFLPTGTLIMPTCTNSSDNCRFVLHIGHRVCRFKYGNVSTEQSQHCNIAEEQIRLKKRGKRKEKESEAAVERLVLLMLTARV